MKEVGKIHLRGEHEKDPHDVVNRSRSKATATKPLCYCDAEVIRDDPRNGGTEPNLTS